jgi:transposase
VKPHLKKQWCIGEINSNFIWHMEQVLDQYGKPYNPDYPVVCFDERPCQLIEDVLQPMPIKEGQPKREDSHYKRNGTAVVLAAIEPLKGKRIVEVREQKTKKDYADFMSKLARQYPEAKKIILIQDNLNTHNPSSFYENMSAKEAFELAQRFEMIYTPKKASWLNMAEIEFSALSKQCLDRRIGNLKMLMKEVNAWARKRNKDKIKISWQFTMNSAREKFKRFYNDISINN